MSVLETRRLILRPLRLNDAPQYQALFPHWNIVKYMSTRVPWPYPENGIEEFLKEVLPKMASNEEYDWAITVKAEKNDLLTGLISIYPNREDNRGFWLAEKYHRQGLMKEAAAAVTDFAFDTLQMPGLTLSNAEPNLASHRIKEKAGATIAQIEYNIPYVSGTFPRVRWLLKLHDWRRCRESFLR